MTVKPVCVSLPPEGRNARHNNVIDVRPRKSSSRVALRLRVRFAREPPSGVDSDSSANHEYYPEGGSRARNLKAGSASRKSKTDRNYLVGRSPSRSAFDLRYGANLYGFCPAWISDLMGRRP